MLGPSVVALGLALTTAAWGQATVTGAFQAQPTCLFLSDVGPSAAAVELVYPAHTVSTPGQFARWPLPTASPGRAATLSFYRADSFTGPTAGYHVLQVVLADKVLWAHDVAGGDLQPQRVELPLPAQDLPASVTWDCRYTRVWRQGGCQP